MTGICDILIITQLEADIRIYTAKGKGGWGTRQEKNPHPKEANQIPTWRSDEKKKADYITGLCFHSEAFDLIL